MVHFVGPSSQQQDRRQYNRRKRSLLLSARQSSYHGLLALNVNSIRLAPCLSTIPSPFLYYVYKTITCRAIPSPAIQYESCTMSIIQPEALYHVSLPLSPLLYRAISSVLCHGCLNTSTICQVCLLCHRQFCIMAVSIHQQSVKPVFCVITSFVSWLSQYINNLSSLSLVASPVLCHARL